MRVKPMLAFMLAASAVWFVSCSVGGDMPAGLHPHLSERPNRGAAAAENESFRIYEPAPHTDAGSVFTVTGEASVPDGTVYYVVEDGHFVLDEGKVQAEASAPEWGAFVIQVDAGQPANSMRTLIVYGLDPVNGSKTGSMYLPVPFQPEVGASDPKQANN